MDPRWDDIFKRLAALEKAVKKLTEGNKQESSSTETPKKPTAKKGNVK